MSQQLHTLNLPEGQLTIMDDGTFELDLEEAKAQDSARYLEKLKAGVKENSDGSFTVDIDE